MIVIRALDGTDVHADENAVILVTAAADAGAHTTVHGINRSAVVIAEDAAALIARLGVNPPLAKLTRPDRMPVWIKGLAVTAIRAPLATERQATTNAIVILGGLHQAIHEDVAAARRILNANGANV